MRLAPKVLRSGAEELARSATYTAAAFGLRHSGASAGINTRGTERARALEAFRATCAPLVSSRQFLPNPGKGVSQADLEPLSINDPRHRIRLEVKDGISFADRLVGRGAVAAVAAALNGLEGLRVVFEGGGAAAVAAAGAAAERGATVVGFATPQGACSSTAGLDPDALSEAWQAHGEALTHHIEAEAAQNILAVDGEVLFLGSKMGALTHVNASGLQVRAVSALHPIPFTTRALIVLQGAGAVVLPDFACLGGQLFASWPEELAHLEGEAVTAKAVEAAAARRIEDLVKEIVEYPDGALLGGCLLAESFMLTWREETPFGRPLAP